MHDKCSGAHERKTEVAFRNVRALQSTDCQPVNRQAHEAMRATHFQLERFGLS